MSQWPDDDITVEVKEEGVEHQLFSGSEAIEPLLLDADVNGKPIGLALL
jgi:hypothetical protein